MTQDRIERFVRRGRARLEALRALRAAARGALAGGACGLVALAAGKLGLAIAAWLPWALTAAGALVGALVALLSPRIRLASAALYLDERLETRERLVTVVTRDTGRFGPRLLAELDGIRRLPRLPLPREVSLVPAALFLLFVVGLLPDANGEPAVHPELASPPATPGAEAGGTSTEEPKDVSGAVARLARGDKPRPAEVNDVRRAIEGAVFSPEERRAALDALRRAAEGDGNAAKRVAKVLKAAQGGTGPVDDTALAPLPKTTDGGGAAAVTAYPEHRELVLAYKRALAEEKSR